MRLFADADLDARERIGAAEVDDVLQSLLSAVRALAADADHTDVEGDIIRQYNNLLGWDFVEIHRLGYRLPAEVHVGGRLHQQTALAADPCFAYSGLEFDLVDLHAQLLGNVVDRDEARVMAGAFILLARVAESDNDVFDTVVGEFFLFEKHKISFCKGEL